MNITIAKGHIPTVVRNRKRKANKDEVSAIMRHEAGQHVVINGFPTYAEARHKALSIRNSCYKIGMRVHMNILPKNSHYNLYIERM